MAKNQSNGNAAASAAADRNAAEAATAQQETPGIDKQSEKFLDEISPLEAAKNDNLEFETVSNGARVWEFSPGAILLAVFLGTGKTLGDGNKKTKTWLFGIPVAGKASSMAIQEYVFVPQWFSVAKLADMQPGEKMVRLTYKNTIVKGEGAEATKYHDVKVEAADLATPYIIDKHFDLSANE